MHELAYLNGEYLPANEVRISVTDWGFVQGVTLAEQLRSFGGKPFRVEQHLERLLNGLTIVGWESSVVGFDLDDIVAHLAQHNHVALDPADDLGVCLFVTPGDYPGYNAAETNEPVVCAHTYPLAFHLWHDKYQLGATLITTSTRQVPTDCWPSDLKCRSRMHYYLAAREARRRQPGATALLLDHDGHVVETPTANVVAYYGNSGLVSPSRKSILPGVSLGYVTDLAKSLGVPMDFRDICAEELEAADEILLTSTPFCLLPVTRFNERKFSGPGPLYRELLHAWSHDVQVDIAAQADRFATRGR